MKYIFQGTLFDLLDLSSFDTAKANVRDMFKGAQIKMYTQVPRKIWII